MALQTTGTDKEYLSNILNGRIGSGKGSKTVEVEGEKFNINSHEERRDAYIAVCKEKGIAVDYKVLTESALENKYLSKNKERQTYIISDVVENEAYDVGKENWNVYFSGSEGRSGLEKEVNASEVVRAKSDEANNQKEKVSYFAKAAVIAITVVGSTFFPSFAGTAECPPGERSYSIGRAENTRSLEEDCLDERDGILAKVIGGKVVKGTGLAPEKRGNEDIRPDDFSESKYSVHAVVSGDTLSDIANDNNVSLAKLEEMNPGVVYSNWIYPGDSVYIPVVADENAELEGILSSFSEEGAVEEGLVAPGPEFEEVVVKRGLGDNAPVVSGLEPRVEDEDVEIENIVPFFADKDVKIEYASEDMIAPAYEGESEWESLYYEDMKRRSPVLDQDGRADPSMKKFIGAVSKNYEGFREEIDDFGSDFGYSNGKTMGRLESAGGKFVSALKNLAHFFSGSLYEPKEIKERRAEEGSNRFTDWGGALGGSIYNIYGSVVDIADIPTAGVVSDVVGVPVEFVKGSVGTVLDATATVVGGATAVTIQPSEEILFNGNSPLSKTINGVVGTAGRFLENVIEGEVIHNSNFSEDGDDKGVIGPTLEMGFSYFLLGESIKKNDDSSGSGDPVEITDPVNIINPGNDTPVGN